MLTDVVLCDDMEITGAITTYVIIQCVPLCNNVGTGSNVPLTVNSTGTGVSLGKGRESTVILHIPPNWL